MLTYGTWEKTKWGGILKRVARYGVKGRKSQYGNDLAPVNRGTEDLLNYLGMVHIEKKSKVCNAIKVK